MAVFVKARSPQLLWRKIREGIEDNEVRTWMIDSDGDITHDVDQWRFDAWLRPFFTEDEIIFGIISRKDVDMTKTVYGVFHGRFAEMLLTHFDNYITDIRLSSMPTKYDSI